MPSDPEVVVRSLLDSYAARDRAAVLNHYAEDARWHVLAWQNPRTGRDAIGAELDQQFAGFSGRRCRTLNLASKDGVVFVEGIDTVTIGGEEITLHWSSVLEIDTLAGKIACQRDYWDSRELDAQLS